MLILFSSVAASLMAAGALASPLSSTHAVHETRALFPDGWIRREPLDRQAALPMSIALTESNLDKGHAWLMDVSQPSSEKYGQHWTPEEIARAFAPSDETVDAVKQWLESSGISNQRVKQSESKGWLKFTATVGEAESLLRTKYHLYEHESTGQFQVGAEEYSVPASLKAHIDFVLPTVNFDVKLSKSRRSEKARRDDGNIGLGQPGSGSLPKLGVWLGSIVEVITQLVDCDKQTTLWCLRLLYGIPANNKASTNAKNSFGIVEYTPQAYRPSDLDLFFNNFSPGQVGNRPLTQLIDGAIVQQNAVGFDYNGESDLDLEYAMSLVFPQNVTLYQVGDNVEGASFSDFLDALDGSFCANDSATFDASYPDPHGGYQGPKICGGIAASKVISTSYAYDEIALSTLYAQRQCNEYLKLGLLGTTFLFSSGDYGVAGNGGLCIAPGSQSGTNASYTDGSSGMFNPSFPGTCPYVTAVGGTQIKTGNNIVASLALGLQPEEACQTVIYSGGGFSNVFPMPDYQSTAVNSYFRNHNPAYGADRYNNSRRTRGFPDISANAANYVTTVDDQFALVYGTSASTPVVASMISLVNQNRLNSGKSAVGFINPTVYAHPEVFNDITQGGNQGCGTQGFTSVTGWDPVTGMGTPKFAMLLSLFSSLP